MTETDPLSRLRVALVVGLGGFAGAILRYAVELLVPSPLVATAAANVGGCLALGFVFYEDQYVGSMSTSARLAVATGFLSSFTTYSTFVVGAATADPRLAAAYVVGSYALGFAAVLVGRALAARLATEVGR